MARFMAPLLALCMCFVSSAGADNWSRQGADAGNTRYSADNISASSQLAQSYVKRFYGHYTTYGSTYMYATGVVIRDGQAFIMTNDQPYSSIDDYLPIQDTLFDWSTGATLKNFTQPGYAQWGNHSLHPGENPAEIDSHHYSTTVIWHDDGQIYTRRGGDHSTCGSLNTATSVWRQFGATGYDAVAFIQTYKDRIIYRDSDTRVLRAYQSFKIGPSDWKPGGSPPGSFSMGPSYPEIINLARASGWYPPLYGDIPKVAQDLCLVAASVYDSTAGVNKLYIQATDLYTGTPKWYKGFSSDGGGATGFYACNADFWKFMATESGNYAFFTRGTGEKPTVRVLDLQTGNEKWHMPMVGDNERPLMATHGDSLFVIGAGEQYKVDINTGSVAWTTHTAIQEAGYRITEDPAYQPVVLTDDTLWLVSGQQGSTTFDLLGISTATGQVVQDIDLAARYAGTGEYIVAVDDLVAANGKIAVLLGIESSTDPYPNSFSYATPGNMQYQDLLVFDAVPEPATVSLLLAGLVVAIRRSRRK